VFTILLHTIMRQLFVPPILAQRFLLIIASPSQMSPMNLAAHCICHLSVYTNFRLPFQGQFIWMSHYYDVRFLQHYINQDVQ
jgi:hypothetical protein